MPSNDPNATHKLFTSRIKVPANDYIGEVGRMFYSEADGCMRLSDGVTPGGIPACGGGGGGPGTSDHGTLTGLLDDDHPQYHNDARGDLRYYTKTLLDAGQLDTRYYTEAEINLLLAGKSDVTHNHSGVYEPFNLNIQAHIGSTSNPHNVTAAQILPAQASNGGKYLQTDGTNLSWATASGTSFGTKSGDIVILSGQTQDIDATPFTTYASGKWLITVVDQAGTMMQSYEVHGHYLLGQASTTHSIASHIGDKIRNVVTLVVSASSLILRVANNEAYTIVVRSTKYDIAS